MSWVMVGVTAISATASIVGGISERNQRKAEAAQYERNAQLAKIGADQAEALRRGDLVSTLSAIRSIRTARGLDPASPTGVAINEGRARQAQTAIGAERLNALNQAQAYRSQAAISRSQGNTAMLTGFMRAGSSVLGSGLMGKK